MEKEKQELKITEWQNMSLGGVEDIAGFDEGIVILETKSGRISVEGDNLKIEGLSRESGEIFIRGNISGVFKSEGEKKRGFFGGGRSK